MGQRESEWKFPTWATSGFAENGDTSVKSAWINQSESFGPQPHLAVLPCGPTQRSWSFVALSLGTQSSHCGNVEAALCTCSYDGTTGRNVTRLHGKKWWHDSSFFSFRTRICEPSIRNIDSICFLSSEKKKRWVPIIIMAHWSPALARHSSGLFRYFSLLHLCMI